MAVKYKSRHKTALERKKTKESWWRMEGKLQLRFRSHWNFRWDPIPLSLSFFPFIVTDYYQIQEYKQFVKTSAAIFQSRKCHHANFWVLDCLKDNNLQPGKIMIYFSRFQHRQYEQLEWIVKWNCKNFFLHCLLETWSVP